MRFAPNEFVSIASAPASMYSRWIAPIRSGRVSTSSSSDGALRHAARQNSSVPIAPSSSSGARAKPLGKGAALGM